MCAMGECASACSFEGVDASGEAPEDLLYRGRNGREGSVQSPQGWDDCCFCRGSATYKSCGVGQVAQPLGAPAPQAVK